MKMTHRVGIGFDSHRLVEGRKLFLGGVQISYSKGLQGHSDADVLLHALTDALLGAAGFGDIGMHFPDSDPQWKDVSSKIFVQKTMEDLRKNRWTVVNVDLLLIAQEPRIAPYRHQILSNISTLLELSANAVNLKATTTDHMGFIGRGEGIAAQAVALLQKNES
jgi:2-C-methyl-D-erythritol 2,4-cyclodiphosphate synthase